MILGRWQNRKHLGSASPQKQQSNWQNLSDVTLYWGDLESTEGLQLPWEALGDNQLISVSFSSRTAAGSHPPLQPHGRQHTHFLSNLHSASGSHGDQKGHCPPNTGDLCSDCCCFFSFLLQLTYSVVLVSSIQQSESVIHIYLSRYISTLCQMLFPYRSLHSTEQSSLCYTVGPALYHQCVYVNSNLPTYPSSSFTPSNHKFVFYACDSISVLWIKSFVSFFFFFRFHLQQCLREGNGTPLQYSCLENPMDREAWWAAVHGISKSRKRLSNFTFTFHSHALEKEMATHSSVLAWRIPGTGEPGGLLSMGQHRVGHN